MACCEQSGGLRHKRSPEYPPERLALFRGIKQGLLQKNIAKS